MDKVFKSVLDLIAAIRASDGSWASYAALVPLVLTLIQDVLALMPKQPEQPVIMGTPSPVFGAMQAESVEGICTRMEAMDASAIGDGTLLKALTALLLKLLPLFI